MVVSPVRDFPPTQLSGLFESRIDFQFFCESTIRAASLRIGESKSG